MCVLSHALAKAQVGRYNLSALFRFCLRFYAGLARIDQVAEAIVFIDKKTSKNNVIKC